MESSQTKGVAVALIAAAAVGGYFLWRRSKPSKPTTVRSTAVVTKLTYYPIKSCRGISVDAADVSKYGFENDRRWMIVDENNRFVTARQIPKMVLLTPSFDDGHLVVSAPDEEPLRIAIDQPGRTVEVTVWEFTGPAVDQGDHVADWLAKVLGRPGLRLVRLADSHKRIVSPKHTKGGTRDDYVTGFTDAFPFLLISEESLADLNSRLENKLPMERFRPNIVVKGAEFPFAEDTWSWLQIGPTTFRGVKKSDRCKMTTIDMQRGEYDGAEPLQTLRTYRMEQNDRQSIYFGMNLVQEEVKGRLRVGDVVQVFDA